VEQLAREAEHIMIDLKGALPKPGDLNFYSCSLLEKKLEKRKAMNQIEIKPRVCWECMKYDTDMFCTRCGEWAGRDDEQHYFEACYDESDIFDLDRLQWYDPDALGSNKDKFSEATDGDELLNELEHGISEDGSEEDEAEGEGHIEAGESLWDWDDVEDEQDAWLDEEDMDDYWPGSGEGKF
jgi:hypothetical protein